MKLGFTCGECGYEVHMENASRMGDKIVLLGTCKRCGNNVAVDVEKLFIAFYTPEQKGN